MLLIWHTYSTAAVNDHLENDLHIWYIHSMSHQAHICPHNMKILELPAHSVTVKLILTDIDYRFRSISLSYPAIVYGNSYLTTIFPLKACVSQFYEPTIMANISFFDCSSVLHLINNRHVHDDGQDIWYLVQIMSLIQIPKIWLTLT
jgi:hypothetical protein